MKALLNAGFGEPLSQEDMALVRDLGYSGIRTDVRDVDNARMLWTHYQDHGLEVVYVVPVADRSACGDMVGVLCAGSYALEGRGVWWAIEVGNEEDLRGKIYADNPGHFGALVAAASLMAAQSHVPLISGGISSLSVRALTWLREAARYFHRSVIVGYHQYREGDVLQPKDGFASRDEEFEALQRIAAGRPIACTETGWHTAPVTKGCWPFKRTVQHTDAEVAAWLREELWLNAANGAVCTVVYQLNDGPDAKNDQHRYGIRRQDGVLKPAAGVVAALAAQGVVSA